MLFMLSPEPGLGVNLDTDPHPLGVYCDGDPLPLPAPGAAHTQQTGLGLVTGGQEVTLLRLSPGDEGALWHVQTRLHALRVAGVLQGVEDILLLQPAAASLLLALPSEL